MLNNYFFRKLPLVGNLRSAKNTQTEDSPKECKSGLTEPEASLKQNDKLWCQDKIKSLGRKFNLDLAPKVSSFFQSCSTYCAIIK